MEKLLDLYPGISLWRVHLDNLRERDINARVMSKYSYDLLSSTIAEDQRLESLPLCRLSTQRENEMEIISGHHRTRAARTAGVLEIYVLCIDDSMTEDQVKAKQLAHNAISGSDDAIVLKKIYDSIEDLEQRLKTGITDLEQKIEREVKLNEVNFDFNFEIVNIMFLPTKLVSFEKAMSLCMAGSSSVLVAPIDDFEELKKIVRQVQKHDNVRNISGIMARMSEIVIEYYMRREADKADESDNQ